MGWMWGQELGAGVREGCAACVHDHAWSGGNITSWLVCVVIIHHTVTHPLIYQHELTQAHSP